MTALAVLIIIAATFSFLGILALVTQIGKPRAPLDGGVVAAAAIYRLAVIALLVITAITLLTASK